MDKALSPLCIPAFGATIGMMFAFFVGQAMDVVVNGYIVRVELMGAPVGLLLGYFLAKLVAPMFHKVEEAKG